MLNDAALFIIRDCYLYYYFMLPVIYGKIGAPVRLEINQTGFLGAEIMTGAREIRLFRHARALFDSVKLTLRQERGKANPAVSSVN
jgi:hypothetical protein